MIIYAQIENDSFYWLTRLTVYITSLTDVFDGDIHTPRVTADFSVFCQLTNYLIVVVLATLDVLNT